MKSLKHLVVFLPLLVLSLPAVAATWQQPTAEELSMTSVPGAPGAAAVYLYREDSSDDNFNFRHIYVRLKVLTEDGKKYADVEMPSYEKGIYRVDAVQGRTIHSDGSIVPYSGKPMDKLVMQSRDYQVHTMVFTMPDVQVGAFWSTATTSPTLGTGRLLRRG